jgi:hypothetical protein
MKYAPLVLIIFAALSSCKKEAAVGSSGLSPNSWSVGNTVYTVDQVDRGPSNEGTVGISALGRAGTMGSTLLFRFRTVPATTSSLRIGGGVFSIPNEVAIEVATANNRSYSARDTTDSKMLVVVNGGKLSVTVPEMWLYHGHYSNNSFIAEDSVRFACQAVREQ